MSKNNWPPCIICSREFGSLLALRSRLKIVIQPVEVVLEILLPLFVTIFIFTASFNETYILTIYLKLDYRRICVIGSIVRNTAADGVDDIDYCPQDQADREDVILYHYKTATRFVDLEMDRKFCHRTIAYRETLPLSHIAGMSSKRRYLYFRFLPFFAQMRRMAHQRNLSA
jgi:hypothetical protein